MQRRQWRMTLDLALAGLLAFEMLAQLAGNVAHEVGGILLFMTIAAHLVLSWRWVRATSLAAMHGRRLFASTIVRMALGAALVACTAVLMLTSVAISKVLLAATGVELSMNGYRVVASIHIASAYVLRGLAIAHPLAYWSSVAAALRIPYDRDRRAAINACVAVLGTVAIAALGSTGVGTLTRALASTDAGGDDGAAGSDADTGTSGTVSVGDSPHPTSAPGASTDTDVERPSDSESAGPHRHGKHGEGRGSSNTSLGTPTSEDSTGAEGDAEERPVARPAGGQERSESGQTSTALGTCPICGRGCSLGSPGCNRPREAGLI